MCIWKLELNEKVNSEGMKQEELEINQLLCADMAFLHVQGSNSQFEQENYLIPTMSRDELGTLGK